MLFNLFGKKNNDPASIKFVDKIFGSTVAKIRACVALAKERQDVIFIAWFPATLHDFQQAFIQQGISGDRVKDYHFIHGVQLLNSFPVFIEHYPMRKKEIELTQNWPLAELHFYSGLDEPFFHHFGGDKIIALLDKLNMNEDQAIEHKLITQSVINAQQKVEKKVLIEQPAQSQKEWIEKNLG